MKEGSIHQKIREKKLDSKQEKALFETIEEIKKSYPQYEYTEDNPPPKDPLIAVTELSKRRQQWFNEKFGEQ